MSRGTFPSLAFAGRNRLKCAVSPPNAADCGAGQDARKRRTELEITWNLYLTSSPSQTLLEDTFSSDMTVNGTLI